MFAGRQLLVSQSLDGTALRTQPQQQPSVGAPLMGQTQARMGSSATLARPASGTRLKAPYSTGSGQPGRHVLYSYLT